MLKKQGVPQDQVDSLLELVNKNPELFKKIGDEVQVEMKKGKDQMTAAMEVAKKYESELKKLV